MSDKVTLDARGQERCEQLATRLIPVLRDAAQKCGYAIGVHGSLRRDIDLIAVPWTADAVDMDTLIAALESTLQEHVGFVLRGGEPDNPVPRIKPHGRTGWVWHLGGGPYIDLSIMPRK